MFWYKELSMYNKIWPINVYYVYLLEKRAHFHEKSMLYCDNQKDYIFFMKYYTFISSIYVCVGINKCVLIQGIIYMQ